MTRQCRRIGTERRNSVRILECEDRRKVLDDVTYMLQHWDSAREYREVHEFLTLDLTQ
jgi:hypothetical protein